ncbi:hypothetical protein K491DRAFT_309466 [Lophiostoma macrostomum CBS 122681]|uniref:Uncharacterized protein n=1 Tax=Lophiostoma macrostomum CBS 122681 TaxID=1314788 RepID=A0A6A6SI05_9PLEO|nr:hypothetical protein K491DRAFT_309466 [Lophiostoma macrostomum CBS 122681]
MTLDNAVVRSPEKIRHIIEEALSPLAQQAARPDHSGLEDQAVTTSSRFTDKLQTREGTATIAHDVFTPHKADSIRKANQWECSALFARASLEDQFMEPPPIQLPNTPIPSPLRRVANYDSICSPSSPMTSPIRSGTCGGADTSDVTFLSSPIRPFNTSNTAKTFEVEATFLQAMVRLLERQANTIPEHLFTKAEVNDVVRKELDKQKRDTEPEVSPGRSLSILVGPSETVAMMMGGASVVVLLRVHEKCPWWMQWFVGGACRGAVYGFLGAMAIKCAFWEVDRIRRV